MLSLVLASVVASSTTEVEAKVVSASLFKNGYAVVLREAPIESNTVRVTNPPLAVLGTLWLGSSPGVTVESATFRRVQETSSRPANTLQEVLGANTGKTLTFVIPEPTGGGHTHLTGVLVRVTTEIAILRVENTEMVIPRTWILAITSAGDELLYEVEASRTVGVVDVVTTSNSGKIYFLTLEPGLFWAPSYRVELDQPNGKAKLTMRSTIINDLADLQVTDLQLVTGFPNIPYLNVRDPFTSGADLSEWSQELGARPGGVPADMMQNVAARRSEGTSGLGGFGGRPEFELLPPTDLEGMTAGELFFYPQNDVTLAKGERGYYTLFQSEAEYRRTFAAQIGSGTIQPPPRTPGSTSFAEERPEDVWLEVIFQNNSGNPLTTAAATIYQSGELIGQDTLEYVPAGADVRLRITKALDVRVSQSLEAIERERSSLVIRNTTYDLLTVEGVITIRNLKNEEIDVELSRRFDGEIIENDPSGQSRQVPVGTTGINPVTIGIWKTKVEPNSVKEIKYRYTVYQQT